MTYRECIRWIEQQKQWAWTMRWWRTYQVAVVAKGRSWSTEDIDQHIPRGVQALGCQGRARSDALWDYVIFDLDVGHGRDSYQTLDAALAAADRIAGSLGSCEVRLSKSGKGVHVRYVPPQPVADGPGLAKQLAADLKVKTDRAVLGRQVQFIWTRTPKPDGFRLIRPITSEHGADLVKAEDWETWR